MGLIPAAPAETAVRFLLALAGRGGPGRLREDQRDLIRSAVHQDVPFDEMREGFRRMQRRWRRCLLQRAGDDPPAAEQRELTVGLVLRGAGFFDEQIDLIVAEYLAQREWLLSNEVVERSEAALALLAREPIPADRASQVLGLPVGGHHPLTLVLFADGDDVALARRMTERVLRKTRDALGCAYSLALAGPDGPAWLGRVFSPPQDWPLALSDFRSVALEDGLSNTLCFVDELPEDPFGPVDGMRRVTHGWEFYLNPEHERWHFPEMTRDEVLFFTFHDSDHDRAWRVPHSAFLDPTAQATVPRHSIEFRTIAFFE